MADINSLVISEPSEDAFGLAIEYPDGVIVQGLEELRDSYISGESTILNIIMSVSCILDRSQLSNSRVVLTGNFSQSVADRTPSRPIPFSMNRGSGTVGGKTMKHPVAKTIDILISSNWAAPIHDEDYQRIVRHLAAHEAVHASFESCIPRPFRTETRDTFGEAMSYFTAVAGDLVEEFLAECISNKVQFTVTPTSTDSVVDSCRALYERVSGDMHSLDRLPLALEALKDYWITLSYYAAELKTDLGFAPVSQDIANSFVWQRTVKFWWDDFTGLLSEVPITTTINIELSDDVIKRLGKLLQQWAFGLGFDYHNDDSGRGPWFSFASPGSRSRDNN
jgi:hypothetical protein